MLYSAAGNSSDEAWYNKNIIAYDFECGVRLFSPTSTSNSGGDPGFTPNFAAEGRAEGQEFADGMYGLMSSALEYQFDTTAPVVTTSVPPGTASQTPISLVFNESEPSDTYYTTDGSTPTLASTQYGFSGFREQEGATLTFTQTTTLKWFSVDPKGNTSGVQTARFVVDTVPPTIALTTPADGAIYRQGASIAADYSCDDNEAVDSCVGDVPSGDPIDTSSLGSHSFTVTAEDTAGNRTVVTHSYYVTPTRTSNPQSWGNGRVSPGETVQVGYDFTLPGGHPATNVLFVDGQVAFDATCANGSGGGTIVVPIENRAYAVAANSSAWYPSGSASSPSVYQGSRAVPDLCGGGQISLGKGTFAAGILADKTVTLQYRWHYKAGGTGGGWSGTYSVTPDLIP